MGDPGLGKSPPSYSHLLHRPTITAAMSDYLDDSMRSALNKARFLQSEGYCEEWLIHFVKVQMRKAYQELEMEFE